MKTGKCPKHNCEYTGFGTLVFCPQCEMSGNTGAAVGYFADFMGEKVSLVGNAKAILIYKDLDTAQKTAQGLVEDYAQFADSNIELEIYKVKRNDLHDIQFSDSVLGTGGQTAEVFAGFPGCAWHSSSKGMDTTKLSRATIEVSPVVTVSPAVV